MILCEHCGGREKMNKEFLDAIEANPIIAAVKDEQGLRELFGQGGAYRDLYPVWRYPFYWGELWSGSTRRGRSRWHI